MSTREQEIDVADNRGDNRYEMSLDGQMVGFLDYILTGDRMVLTYVEVVAAVGGRGLGGRLTEAVLEDCRARGLKVVPECPFIVRYIREHPEYADLVG